MAKSNFNVRFRISPRSFFNSSVVINKMDGATRKVLGKIGAFVRRTARQSLRSGKKISAPGRPPKSHTRLLKRLILFGVDFARRSVVIGPIRAPGKTGDIPPTLEFGGPVIARLRHRSRSRKLGLKRQLVFIRARPFMGPALRENEPKFAGFWKDSIRA